MTLLCYIFTGYDHHSLTFHAPPPIRIQWDVIPVVHKIILKHVNIQMTGSNSTHILSGVVRNLTDELNSGSFSIFQQKVL